MSERETIDSPPSAAKPPRDFLSDGCFLGGCLSPVLWLLVVLTAYGMHVAGKYNNLVWTAAYGILIALLGLIYVRVRRRRPQFARGLGYSVLVLLALWLGALVVCGSSPG
jgi:hypothetical protein